MNALGEENLSSTKDFGKIWVKSRGAFVNKHAQERADRDVPSSSNYYTQGPPLHPETVEWEGPYLIRT